ncbi:MAG: type II secretion system minor pseudopilin GspI [Gammaproteobacteria bacterium]
MADNANSRQRAAGFTLVEILVALAILAIAVAAVVAAVSANVSNAAYLRDRTLAHWVAMNKVAEMQVDGDWPSPGTKHGDSLMAEQKWSWQITVSTTDDKDVRRLDVDVYGDKDQKDVLATLVAYVGRSTQSNAAATGTVAR